jgi:hypothetical protein
MMGHILNKNPINYQDSRRVQPLLVVPEGGNEIYMWFLGGHLKSKVQQIAS